GPRLVAEPPRHEGDRLTRNARARHDDRVAPIVLRQGAQPHGGDRDLDLRERLPGVACDLTGDRHRLLRGEQSRERENRADNDGYEPTARDSHVPSDAVCVTRMNRRRPAWRRGISLTNSPHSPADVESVVRAPNRTAEPATGRGQRHFAPGRDRVAWGRDGDNRESIRPCRVIYHRARRCARGAGAVARVAGNDYGMATLRPTHARHGTARRPAHIRFK